MADNQRPLSPHLGIYKWPLAMAISILHRITGVALAFGAVLMVAVFVAVAADPKCYEWIQGILVSKIGKAFLFLWTFALFLHLCNGIRHLFWDAGYGFDKQTTYNSGVFTLVATVVLTLAVWCYAYFFLKIIMSLRTPLSEAKGLGSAKEGASHWWLQRLTAIALVPLAIWFAFAVASIGDASHAEVYAWLANPYVAVALILFIAATFYHTQLGLQVIVEDYVHGWLKVATLIIINFLCIALAVIGIVALLKIFL